MLKKLLVVVGVLLFLVGCGSDDGSTDAGNTQVEIWLPIEAFISRHSCENRQIDNDTAIKECQAYGLAYMGKKINYTGGRDCLELNTLYWLRISCSL